MRSLIPDFNPERAEYDPGNLPRHSNCIPAFPVRIYPAQPNSYDSRNLTLLFRFHRVLPHSTRLLASILGVFLPSCNGQCPEHTGL